MKTSSIFPIRSRPVDPGAAMTRRQFVGWGAVGAAALGGSRVWVHAASNSARSNALEELTSHYLTPDAKFGTVGRGKPVPDTLPLDKRRSVGLERDTWQLEVVADPDSDSKIEQPLSKELGTALDWPALMKLAERHATRYLKVMTCNNMPEPLGMGLWEGVPLREVIWRTRPAENVRHIYYYGFHNDDPKQMFQSWLPVNRVLEDPPGELPVLLCYKLNGEWLSPKRGGPVRILVPEAYGFKSVKWLQRIVLTNNPKSDDTYAQWNNDSHSWLKTFARFVSVPKSIRAGQPVSIIGRAQVGISGLARVQYWLHPQNAPWPADDPYFATAPWQDAEILPLSPAWHRDLPDGKMPAIPSQFDPASAKPREWPMRYTLAHWAALLANIPAGRHDLRCRTIDVSGHAQPMPRPFPKSGQNAIHTVSLIVEPG